MINQKMLKFQLAQLRDNTGLNLELSTYSPGDGWTRYTLVEVDWHGGERELSHTVRRGEMYDTLYAMNRVLGRMHDEGIKREERTNLEEFREEVAA